MEERLPAFHPTPPAGSLAGAAPRARRGPGRRVLLLLAAIAAQAALLKLTIHPRADGAFLTLPGGLFQPLLYLFLGFGLLLSTRYAAVWQSLVDSARNHRWRRMLAPQLASYALLAFCASRLLPTAFSAAPALAWPVSAWWTMLLAVSVALTCGFSLALVAPAAWWAQFARREWKTLLLACIFPLSHFIVYSLVVRSEDWLSGPTMAVVRFLLELAYDDVSMDFAAKVIGTSRFDVIIDHLCSGYEGIGMMTVFLIWYLHSFSRDFRFPAALWLFPLAALAIWLSNCLRIALLIGIGSSMSSEVAMDGFHANAGWIFFIAVALGMVALARRSPFFCRRAAPRGLVIDADNALAIPLLAMLAATLLTSAMESGFPWLYPVRMLATAAAIALLWPHLRPYLQLRFTPAALLPRLFPALAGLLVFLLWIALVPPSAAMDRAFSDSLFAAPAALSAAWIVMRIAGSSVVIPIAEELAFRGYLPLLFRGGADAFRPGGPIHWPAFAASSLLFGALHDAWLAGTLAGAAYYLVRQRSGRLSDSIVAHGTTNLLLCAYVLIDGRWSYW